MAVETKSSYRATFILDTRGVEGSVDSLYEQITTVFEGLGGEVTKVGKPRNTRIFACIPQHQASVRSICTILRQCCAQHAR